jgi:hypothetical protein
MAAVEERGGLRWNGRTTIGDAISLPAIRAMLAARGDTVVRDRRALIDSNEPVTQANETRLF